jgi:tetratricopeptide (TPR) repeat protein
MFRIIKNLLSSLNSQKENNGNIAKLKNFANLNYSNLTEEYNLIKNKFDNLLETNYNQGLSHLSNNKISEAIFRFRFIKKFWPNHLDSYYQLAICYLKKEKTVEAKNILQELFTKKPDYNNQDAINLFNSLNNIKSN